MLNLPDIAQLVLAKYDVDLLKLLAENRRYRNMKLTYYVNQIENESQMQFSAVTVQISKKLHFVSYRGTDNTLVGWKEDFNMSFTCPVPAQKSAVEYLEQVASKTTGELILGGHSKGGNLAVYAAAFCKQALQGRIATVYNFDGPGFSQKVIKAEGYINICNKVTTYVPQSSIVGMLLEHEEKYTIIHSNQLGIMQHDIYSWMVERNHLVTLREITNSSKVIDRTLKQLEAKTKTDRNAE